MNRIANISRREFVRGMFSTGALVLSASLAPKALWAGTSQQAVTSQGAVLRPNLFVAVQPDDTISIISARSEMGTGISTSLPVVLADELDADWTKVTVQQGDGDKRYGDQDTDGSHSVRSFFEEMRSCGATARHMLIAAAAAQWKVSPEECETKLGTVIHRPSGRKLTYGQLAGAASKLQVPDEAELRFKPSSSWRYIGKDTPRHNLAALCTGKAVFGIDQHVEGMLYASVERPPVFGGKLKSYDDKETLHVAGVHQTVPIPPFVPPCAFQALGGIAVIADNTWAALQGRQKLKVVWDNGPNADYDSGKYHDQLRATSRKPCKMIRNAGDVEAEFAKDGKILEADYYVPLLAHVSMEPPAAVADFRDGNVTVWAPTQDPQSLQSSVASELDIPVENVTCHVTLLGGGFGRKSKADFAVEAAYLSKVVGRPVKVTWSREDDIKFDYYNSTAAMYLKAALGKDGKPRAWLQRSTFPPISSIFKLNAIYGDPPHLAQGWTDVPYDIPNLRIENGPAQAHVRIGWLRSVANIYHAFAVQCFADELAHIAGRDPLDYLRDLIGPPRILDLNGATYSNYGASYKTYPIDTARLRRVLDLAAEKSGWAKRKSGNGTGCGIAVHRSFVTYVATVVQVEVSSKGEVRIPRVDTAVDAGQIVDPRFVQTQFEGAAVFGTSVVRSGEITATSGAIDQSNFFDYPVARINEAPFQTNVHIIESTAPPGGVGEPGVPPFVAAFCNAIFAATGKRVRELPLSKIDLARHGTASDPHRS
jgi:isoquinoline 1-oxidoreductase beta subunit